MFKTANFPPKIPCSSAVLTLIRPAGFTVYSYAHCYTYSRSYSFTLLFFVIQGVNFSIPGTGGAECVAFIPDWQKACETLFALAVSFCFTYAGWRKVKVDTKPQQYGES